MPTYEMRASFWRDYRRLSPEEQAEFRQTITQYVRDLRSGRVREGFRIKRVRRRPGIWELTWAPDGRATFEYGESPRPGDIHVIWRRVGSHDILRDP